MDVVIKIENEIIEHMNNYVGLGQQYAIMKQFFIFCNISHPNLFVFIPLLNLIYSNCMPNVYCICSILLCVVINVYLL